MAIESLEGRTLMSGDIAPMTLGMNLGRLDYYSPAPMFVDAMKNGTGWMVVQANSLENPFSISGVQKPSMDADGYPEGLGNLPAQGYALSTAPFLHNGGTFPAGAYTLVFDGDGTVVVHQGLGAKQAITVNQSGGTGQPHTVNVVQSDLGIIVSIIRSNPNDYVRNIRLIMPGFQDTYQTQPFNPAYLQGLQSFNVLRFMDPMRTNGQTIQHWSDRTTVDDMSQTGPAGLAVEYMVQLANTLHKDMWVNMPDLAQDDYVQGFALYAREHLDPGLRVYVEYGNEDWNWGSAYNSGWQFIEDYATAHGIGHDAATADLAKHDWDIWRQTFGEQSGRVERVLATQVSVTYHLDGEIRRLVMTSDPDDPDHGFEVVSGAPYFGPSTSETSEYTAATTVQDIEADAMSALTSTTGPRVSQFMATTASWGSILGRKIPVIMYEGGWGMTDYASDPWYPAYLQAQTDPGMYAVTTAYLNELNSLGVDGLIYYSYVSEPSKRGEWGSMAHLGQPASQTPKLNALVDYASAVPPTIGDISVSSRTDTSATITWTTRVPSSSQVDYGTGGSFDSSRPLDPDPVSIHTVQLTGLSPNTVYHYRVRSVRESGLGDASGDLTFSTRATSDSRFDYTDFTDLKAHFGQIGQWWPPGDFNHDNAVNQADLDILRSNLGAVTPAQAVEIALFGSPTTGAPEVAVPFNATGHTDTLDATGHTDTLDYSWSTSRDGVTVAFGTAIPFTFTPDGLGNYLVTLTVSDPSSGQSATSSVLIDVISTPLFSDDFSASKLNSAWLAGGPWVVNNGVFSQTSTAAFDGLPLKARVMNQTFPANATIVAKVRVNQWAAGDAARVGVSLDNDPNTRQGYSLVFHGTNQVQFVDDGVALGNAYPFHWTTGTWYWFALSDQGGTLLGKVWADGTPEPSAWMFTQAGWNDRTSGVPGLFGGQSDGKSYATASFDNVTISTATATAGLRAAAVSSQQVNLAWDGSATAASYAIDRSPDGLNNWTQLGTITASVTTFQDATVQPSTTFVYRVRALDSSNNSTILGNLAIVTTPIGNTPRSR